MASDDGPSAPIPAGPFFSNYGPRDGLILYGEAPVMGVLDGHGEVVGIAWLAGAIVSRLPYRSTKQAHSKIAFAVVQAQ
jgi:hypothetical protein